jgi:hypothetical protein
MKVLSTDENCQLRAVELMRVPSVLSLGWQSGDLLLNRSETLENRWLILLAVFVAHGALVLLATRATRQMMSAPRKVLARGEIVGGTEYHPDQRRPVARSPVQTGNEDRCRLYSILGTTA